MRVLTNIKYSNHEMPAGKKFKYAISVTPPETASPKPTKNNNT